MIQLEWLYIASSLQMNTFDISLTAGGGPKEINEELHIEPLGTHPRHDKWKTEP